MNTLDIPLLRSANQLLSPTRTRNPAYVVARLGGIQAQDYSGGEWSIGLRCHGSTQTDVERAIAERKIIRTWGLRGTLHFLAASDVDWILGLLGPALLAKLRRRYSELDLDAGTLRKTNSILEKTLKRNHHLTRSELVAVFERSGISCEGQRAVFILFWASMNKIICFGVKRGKQHTHTLFEEWVPRSKSKGREEALADLAWRYFTSHGPATIQDYLWWSGLRAADAKIGIEMIASKLVKGIFETKTYWMTNETAGRAAEPTASLLPSFDELLIGYKNRSASINEKVTKHLRSGGIPNMVIAIDAQVVGTWSRTLKRRDVIIEGKLFKELKKDEKKALVAAANSYGKFLNRSPILTLANI